MGMTFKEIESLLSNKPYTKEYDNAVKEYLIKNKNDIIIDNTFKDIIKSFMSKNNINYYFSKLEKENTEKFKYTILIVKDRKYNKKDFCINITIDNNLDKFTLCIKKYYKTFYDIRSLLLDILIICKFWKNYI